MEGLNWELRMEVRFSCAAISKMANVAPEDKGNFLIAYKRMNELKKVQSVCPSQFGSIANGAIRTLKIGP